MSEYINTLQPLGDAPLKSFRPGGDEPSVKVEPTIVHDKQELQCVSFGTDVSVEPIHSRHSTICGEIDAQIACFEREVLCFEEHLASRRQGGQMKVANIVTSVGDQSGDLSSSDIKTETGDGLPGHRHGVNMKEWIEEWQERYNVVDDVSPTLIFFARCALGYLCSGPVSEKELRLAVIDSCKRSEVRVNNRGGLSGSQVDLSIICGVLQTLGVLDEEKKSKNTPKSMKGGIAASSASAANISTASATTPFASCNSLSEMTAISAASDVSTTATAVASAPPMDYYTLESKGGALDQEKKNSVNVLLPEAVPGSLTVASSSSCDASAVNKELGADTKSHVVVDAMTAAAAEAAKDAIALCSLKIKTDLVDPSASSQYLDSCTNYTPLATPMAGAVLKRGLNDTHDADGVKNDTYYEPACGVDRSVLGRFLERLTDFVGQLEVKQRAAAEAMAAQAAQAEEKAQRALLAFHGHVGGAHDAHPEDIGSMQDDEHEGNDDHDIGLGLGLDLGLDLSLGPEGDYMDHHQQQQRSQYPATMFADEDCGADADGERLLLDASVPLDTLDVGVDHHPSADMDMDIDIAEGLDVLDLAALSNNLGNNTSSSVSSNAGLNDPYPAPTLAPIESPSTASMGLQQQQQQCTHMTEEAEEAPLAVLADLLMFPNSSSSPPCNEGQAGSKQLATAVVADKNSLNSAGPTATTAATASGNSSPSRNVNDPSSSVTARLPSYTEASLVACGYRQRKVGAMCTSLQHVYNHGLFFKQEDHLPTSVGGTGAASSSNAMFAYSSWDDLSASGEGGCLNSVNSTTGISLKGSLIGEAAAVGAGVGIFVEGGGVPVKPKRGRKPKIRLPVELTGDAATTANGIQVPRGGIASASSSGSIFDMGGGSTTPLASTPKSFLRSPIDGVGGSAATGTKEKRSGPKNFNSNFGSRVWRMRHDVDAAFADPPLVFMNWAKACHLAGGAEEQEEAALRQLAGMCGVAFPVSVDSDADGKRRNSSSIMPGTGYLEPLDVLEPASVMDSVSALYEEENGVVGGEGGIVATCEEGSGGGTYIDGDAVTATLEGIGNEGGGDGTGPSSRNSTCSQQSSSLMYPSSSNNSGSNMSSSISSSATATPRRRSGSAVAPATLTADLLMTRFKRRGNPNYTLPVLSLRDNKTVQFKSPEKKRFNSVVDSSVPAIHPSAEDIMIEGDVSACPPSVIPAHNTTAHSTHRRRAKSVSVPSGPSPAEVLARHQPQCLPLFVSKQAPQQHMAVGVSIVDVSRDVLSHGGDNSSATFLLPTEEDIAMWTAVLQTANGTATATADDAMIFSAPAPVPPPADVTAIAVGEKRKRVDGGVDDEALMSVVSPVSSILPSPQPVLPSGPSMYLPLLPPTNSSTPASLNLPTPTLNSSVYNGRYMLMPDLALRTEPMHWAAMANEFTLLGDTIIGEQALLVGNSGEVTPRSTPRGNPRSNIRGGGHEHEEECGGAMEVEEGGESYGANMDYADAGDNSGRDSDGGSDGDDVEESACMQTDTPSAADSTAAAGIPLSPSRRSSRQSQAQNQQSSSSSHIKKSMSEVSLASAVSSGNSVVSSIANLVDFDKNSVLHDGRSGSSGGIKTNGVEKGVLKSSCMEGVIATASGCNRKRRRQKQQRLTINVPMSNGHQQQDGPESGRYSAKKFAAVQSPSFRQIEAIGYGTTIRSAGAVSTVSSEHPTEGQDGLLIPESTMKAKLAAAKTTGDSEGSSEEEEDEDEDTSDEAYTARHEVVLEQMRDRFLALQALKQERKEQRKKEKTGRFTSGAHNIAIHNAKRQNGRSSSVGSDGEEVVVPEPVRRKRTGSLAQTLASAELLVVNSPRKRVAVNREIESYAPPARAHSRSHQASRNGKTMYDSDGNAVSRKRGRPHKPYSSLSPPTAT